MLSFILDDVEISSRKNEITIEIIAVKTTTIVKD
jgi:hypothetical protein